MHPHKYDDMYMSFALKAAEQSKCPRKHVGCCVLLESGMIAIGFNGHAPGGPNEWPDDGEGNPEVVHAEMNAMGKLLEQGVSAKNATVFITYSPCVECAKLLVRAKVKRVVYLEKYRKPEGLEYLKKYGVQVQRYGEPVEKKPTSGCWVLVDGKLIPADYYYQNNRVQVEMCASR